MSSAKQRTFALSFPNTKPEQNINSGTFITRPWAELSLEEKVRFREFPEVYEGVVMDYTRTDTPLNPEFFKRPLSEGKIPHQYATVHTYDDQNEYLGVVWFGSFIGESQDEPVDEDGNSLKEGRFDVYNHLRYPVKFVVNDKEISGFSTLFVDHRGRTIDVVQDGYLLGMRQKQTFYYEI